MTPIRGLGDQFGSLLVAHYRGVGARKFGSPVIFDKFFRVPWFSWFCSNRNAKHAPATIDIERYGKRLMWLGVEFAEQSFRPAVERRLGSFVRLQV